MNASISFLALCVLSQAPVYEDSRFTLPPGFHIYQMADRDLTGQTLAITFDGEGRLLVGDGEQIRRLEDRNADGIFDTHEVLAGGLGGRGPQGLLVYEDRVYAVGGDGVQLFNGYLSGGALEHVGRIGEPFRTGGDHAAHMVQRGHDGYVYFISGDGGGTRDRLHITERNSPVLFERACSVFRVSPDGKHWECIGSGGRNAPNLGINYLGDFFSLDSDMEWHVSQPWWRPVRLHHWAAGGDQGWQEVGAYPPYYIDNLSGILDVGRGSPTWGVFYEHRQFPEKYRDAYFVCDYPHKSATTGRYSRSGRLLVFFLERAGAGWKAEMEVFAEPKDLSQDPGAEIRSFALVDTNVAPDGSLVSSVHNQGIWRIFYTGEATPPQSPPPLVPAWPALAVSVDALVDQLLSLPQPASEWSRVREEAIYTKYRLPLKPRLESVALDRAAALRKRLRAIRLLAPGFESLSIDTLAKLAADARAEIRAQSAWLLGIRSDDRGLPIIGELMADRDPFVRRRAAEALSRKATVEDVDLLLRGMRDPERLVRYVSMNALAHLERRHWLERGLRDPLPQIRMRTLVACRMQREDPPKQSLLAAVGRFLDETSPGNSKEHRLDLLRILGLFRETLAADTDLRARIGGHLLATFPDPDRDIRTEEVRLLGEYAVEDGFAPLLQLLHSEPDGVRQFHIAQALARLPGGWSEESEKDLVAWLLSTQKGFFAEYDNKGLQFRSFWGTVLADFARHHGERLAADLLSIQMSSELGKVVLQETSRARGAAELLLALYRANSVNERARRNILGALANVSSKEVAALLRDEYTRLTDPDDRGRILQALANQLPEPLNQPLILEGLQHSDRNVVSACAHALRAYPIVADENLMNFLLTRLANSDRLHKAMEVALSSLSGRSPLIQDESNRSRAERIKRRGRSLEYWKVWYAKTYGHAFEPRALGGIEEKDDAELHRFLLGSDVKGGDPASGEKIYETVRCASCHGGLETAAKGGSIFGPDLTGVTQRLSRAEIVDAIVYPSRQVPDRFKAVVIQPKGQAPLTGFITDRSADTVTLVDPNRVHRINKKDILFEYPQESSLMPERLLNRLSLKEVRDLYAYLERIGAQAPREHGARGAAPK